MKSRKPNVTALSLFGASLLLSACAGQVVQEKQPLMSHVHYGHALSGWFDTPNKIGLFPNAERLAKETAERAISIDEQLRENPSADVSVFAREIVQRIGNQAETEVGRASRDDSYTLFSSLFHANEHMRFASTSDDASANMGNAADLFSRALAAVYARGLIVVDLVSTLDAGLGPDDRKKIARELRILSIQILEGEDVDGNGVIGNTPSEFGLRQMRDQLAVAAAAENPPYQPVPRKYLFGVLKLPGGKWAFKKSVYQNTYDEEEEGGDGGSSY